MASFPDHFSATAADYAAFRPRYPDALFAWIVAHAPARRRAWDCGAGSGQAAVALAEHFDFVVATDASGAQLARAAPHPRVRYAVMTAERAALATGSADVVTVAQAFHWFDHDRALPEIHRVLRNPGSLALVWNMRDLDDPLQRGVEDLLRAVRKEVPGQVAGTWREPLARSPLFRPATVGAFTYEQRFTTDDLCDRVASTSFVAALPSVDREELFVRIRALTHGLSEPFPFPYKTEVHLIPRSGDRPAASRAHSNQG